MRRQLGLLIILTLSACAFGQAPIPTAKMPPPQGADKNTLYGGFMWQNTDFVSDWGRYYGFDLNYTRSIGHRFGAVVDFDWARNNVTTTDGLDPNVAHNSSDYGLRVGPRYNLLRPEHRFQPYVVALFGGAHFTSKVPYPTNTSPIVQKDWVGFSWAAGGGVDYRLTSHFGVRGEWLHVSEPWGTGTSDHADWDRITFGGAWHF